VIAAVLTAGLVLTMLASAPTTAAGEVQQKGTTYVGTVEGTDAYIGIVVGKSGAFGYICDGEGITHWLHGSVKKSDVTLTAATGASVIAQLGDGTLTGKVLLAADPSTAKLEDLAGATVHDFEAVPAKGRAGLYRQEKTVDGTTFAAGWVRLGDGSLRGEVTVAQVGEQATTSTTAPTATTAPTVTTAPTATTAPTGTTPPTNSGGVQADVGTAVVGQIAPPDVQSRFPPTPRRRSPVTGAALQTRACALAQAQFSQALHAWFSGGMPLSGPLFDQAFAAGQRVSAVCGAPPAGF
jgi:hypothetical protein